VHDTYFSVIIPAFNAERYIAETIESALMQQNVKFEVIVVDDGSTDGTVDVAKSFGNRIRIVSQANSGVSVARNHGAMLAEGDFLAFLDADDIWMPEKLEKQSYKIQEGFNMVYTNRVNIGELGDLPEIQTDIEIMPEGDIFVNLLLGNVITNSSAVINKGIFRALEGFNGKLLTCEDWDLWLRYSIDHTIGFCQTPLVKYRFHAGGKSRNYKRQAAAREHIISSILNTKRGESLSSPLKRKVWAYTYRTSAWSAARFGDVPHSLKLFCKALSICPFEFSIWYDAARIAAGRA